MTDIIYVNDTVTIAVEEEVVNVVTVGVQGPTGVGMPMGGLAGQSIIKNSDSNYDFGFSFINNTISTEIAGSTISALRIVYVDPSSGKILYADKDNLSTINSLLGITIQSGSINSNINVVSEGKIVDSNWNWDMTSNVSLFLGSNGVITQGVSLSSAATVHVGCALSSTSILVRFGEPIIN